MSEQHHHPYDPQRPAEPYPPYGTGPYPPYDTGADAHPPSYGGQDDYGYGQQPAYGRQPAAQWPQPRPEEHDPHDEPVTQTWQTQTWDARAWQQEPPAQESAPYAPPAASYDSAFDSPWPAGGAQGAAEWARQEAASEQAAAPAPPPFQEPYGGPQSYGGPEAYAAPAAAVAVAEPEPAPERQPTAAEKARAEGRPQILPPGLQPALLTSVLAVLLALAAPLARPVLAVPVVLLQAVTAAGWFRLNGMWPARQGIALAFLGGVVADAGLLVAGEHHAPTVLLGTLGVWILLVVVLQLRSHASPDERLYGLTAATASAALAVVAGGLLAAEPDAVVAGALGVAGAALARALPLPSLLSPVVALAAAAGAGVAAGQLTGMGASAALLGAGAGVCALVGLRVASYDYPSRFVHMTAGVALPLTVAAPVVYVLGRVLG